MISPIVISTVHGKGLGVMLESIKQYCPEIPVYLRGPESVIEHFNADVKVFALPTNFGNDYNAIINRALEDFDSVVVANDDIVLTPTSYKLLMEDVDILRYMDLPVGWVASRTDAARQAQNIRFNPDGETIDMCRFKYESRIRPAEVISPIFAWIHGDAFKEANFPPLNWYSDDVQCMDLNAKGFEHYVSTSYVHHVGSQTVGTNAEKLTNDAVPWLLKNRPEYAAQWFNS